MGSILPIRSRAGAAPPRGPLAENARLGMALFVFTEVMLFTGFISAFVIVQSGAPLGSWPPPEQPRLPIERTAVNTLALLAGRLTGSRLGAVQLFWYFVVLIWPVLYWKVYL